MDSLQLLKIASLNIDECSGGTLAYQFIKELIAGEDDVICFQEVPEPVEDFKNLFDLSEWYPVYDRRSCGKDEKTLQGNLTLIRKKLFSSVYAEEPLLLKSDNGGKPTLCQLFSLDTGRNIISLGNIHGMTEIGRDMKNGTPDRTEHANAIASRLKNREKIILVGDYNQSSESDSLTHLESELKGENLNKKNGMTITRAKEFLNFVVTERNWPPQPEADFCIAKGVNAINFTVEDPLAVNFDAEHQFIFDHKLIRVTLAISG